MHIDMVKVLSSMKEDGIKIESHSLKGEYRELCDLIGYDAVEKIYMQYCGGYLSLPKKFFTDDFMHGYIVTSYYNGRTAKDLAREYDYTYSWIMKLIRRAKSNTVTCEMKE